jgi:peptidoglycan L-alanyl-D-glutamate endopeptidase CwlK
MPQLSFSSLAKLDTCDDRLKLVILTVAKHYDCTVLEGARSVEQERENIAKGTSKLTDPMNCKHVIRLPDRPKALAVDVAPFPLDWKDTDRFRVFGGFVKGVAAMLNIPLRWGGDWDGDWDFHDQQFNDLPHFEIAG